MRPRRVYAKSGLWLGRLSGDVGGAGRSARAQRPEDSTRMSVSASPLPRTAFIRQRYARERIDLLENVYFGE